MVIVTHNNMVKSNKIFGSDMIGNFGSLHIVISIWLLRIYHKLLFFSIEINKNLLSSSIFIPLPELRNISTGYNLSGA